MDRRPRIDSITKCMARSAMTMTAITKAHTVVMISLVLKT